MELTIKLPQGADQVATTGSGERNLKIIRDSLGVKLWARGGSVRISGEGEAVGRAAQVLEELNTAAKRRRPLDPDQLQEVIAQVNRDAERDREGHGRGPQHGGPTDELLDVYLRGRRIKPMTEGQQAYVNAIANHDLCFCTGPAGTGKTYLAVAAAVSLLKSGHVRKLVLVRPAVEAGEKLGFLPGSMQEKVNPYLRPLLDALNDMMDFEQIQRFMTCDLIEIVPLAFMRGRTLNDALIILDEAQNTTRAQMMMFLTRLGHGSKMIVTGDTSQIDLEDPRQSGLIDAIRRLRRVSGVAFLALGKADIVRHRLVQRIVEAYGEDKRRQIDVEALGEVDAAETEAGEEAPQ